MPPESESRRSTIARIWSHKELPIAILALGAIVVYLILRFGSGQAPEQARWVLLIALGAGGGPLVLDLAWNVVRGQFGSDLLAGISIVTSLLLDEHLAGVIVVLMLSGGEALEALAVKNASSVLRALASRVPSVARVRRGESVAEVELDSVVVGDEVVIHPHEIAPVDGEVVEGRGSMDESFLTGEPYRVPKTVGAGVISGALNGEQPLVIRATKRAADSRYAKIMRVMQETEQRKPRMRRLGDKLGAWYTPLAVTIALGAWLISGDPVRFLAVLVVATPCPLLIGIPTAIIGAISLAAKRGIIIKDPAVLELATTCRTMILDKTGTLTYGEPALTAFEVLGNFERDALIASVAGLERYSNHPLAAAVLNHAGGLGVVPIEPGEVSEHPGEGLRGVVEGARIQITGRSKLRQDQQSFLPEIAPGLECVVLIDDELAALLRFSDEPRSDSEAFVAHLGQHHRLDRVLLVSGDREEEVRSLADRVGISEVHAEQSPEEKVEIVRRESKLARTVFIGDGINDAPALSLATVGIAFGDASDITTEAAGVVVMDSSLARVDEFFHISARMRRIVLQSVLGGMALSIGGMGFAAAGMLTPVAGAIVQEIIDAAAVLNALRVSVGKRSYSDLNAVTGP